MDYEVEGDNNFGIEDIDGNPLRSKQKKQKDISPISIRKLTPIQMPHVDIDELKQGRKAFTKDEWLNILLRSIGMEPDEFTYREKWLLLTRMIPLVENKFNAVISALVMVACLNLGNQNFGDCFIAVEFVLISDC